MKEERLIIFTNKIREAYQIDIDTAKKNAKEVLEELPDVLLPNVDEWSKDLALSDIYIGDYSIPMILALWKSNDFISASKIMIELERNPDKAIRQIWNMRR